MKTLNLSLLLLAVVAMFACSDDLGDTLGKRELYVSGVSRESAKSDELLVCFAKALSAAVSGRQDVREFLKGEALKKFDKNYDVLYLSAKDMMVGGATFREVLASYSSFDSLDAVANAIPLLNVYLTRTAFLGVYPEEYDVSDEETPVAVPMADSTRFFVAGRYVGSLAKDEAPAFHVFVLGENSRVEVEAEFGDNKSLSSRRFRFKSSSFDGSLEEEVTNLKSVASKRQIVGQRALQAYRYFYRNDNSVNQMGLQRDYIYHSLTPNVNSGALVRGVSEYLGFIRINPSAYYSMADDGTTDNLYADPIAKDEVVKVKGGPWSEDELLRQVWSRGAFNIKFEIISSTQAVANVVYVPLTPDQIWKIEYDYDYLHPTWFRHTKHTYRLRFDGFKAKDVFFHDPVDLGKWNIAEEALYRFIKVSEEDKGREIETKTTYEMVRANSRNFNGDVKLTLGLGKIVNVSGGVSTTATASNTTTVSKSITEKWSEGADNLGQVKVYYYDPVVENASPIRMHTYNTGSVEFGIVVK